jgi:hypothetical protein
MLKNYYGISGRYRLQGYRLQFTGYRFQLAGCREYRIKPNPCKPAKRGKLCYLKLVTVFNLVMDFSLQHSTFIIQYSTFIYDS